MKTFFVVITSIVLSACFPPREAPKPNPKPVSDTALCPTMCAQLEKLSCEEARPYYDNDKPGPRGVPNSTCSQFCVEQQNFGVWLNPKCVSKITKCSEVEAFRKKDPSTCN